MWTATTRAQHTREGLGFASDLTDAEWTELAPLLLAPSRIGRAPASPMREILNAILYVLRGGIPGRLLPPCFLLRQTVNGSFAAWRDRGVWADIAHCLVMADRGRDCREASPSAAMIDSQRVRISEAGGPRSYDAGQKIRGRRRHAMVDTDGRLQCIRPRCRIVMAPGRCCAPRLRRVRSSGITETRKMAHVAHAFNVAFAPHIGGGAVSAAANLQLSAALPNFLTYESMIFASPLREELATTRVGAVDAADGMVPVPDGAGLGIEINLDTLERYRTR
jgi:transposase